MAGSVGFTSAHLVLYDSFLFSRAGKVGRWAQSLERGFTNNTERAAPERSGALKAGIHGHASQVGPRHWVMEVFSDARYTLFVLRGTTGPIMANRLFRFQARTGIEFPRGGRIRHASGFFMPNMEFLKKNNYLLRVRAGNGYGEHYAISVSGQEANNFFATAAEMTARRHRSLRGFSPGYNF